MAKTVSFAAIHFCTAFSVGYLMTGDVMVGSALATVEPAVNTVAYYFHEKFWNHSKGIRPENVATTRYSLQAIHPLQTIHPLKALSA